MMIGARTGAWAKSGGVDPLYVGVSLVGDSVRNDNGILSGFSANSYAVLPFITEPWDKAWEVVISATPTQSVVSNGGMGGVGGGNGWTPIYFHENDTFYSFLNTVKWGFKWNYRYKLSENVLKVSYDGASIYSLHELVYGDYKETFHSSGKVQGGQTIQIGTNRGNSYPFQGTWDLNKCYIIRDGVLYWEGVKGAYRNVNGHDFI